MNTSSDVEAAPHMRGKLFISKLFVSLAVVQRMMHSIFMSTTQLTARQVAKLQAHIRDLKSRVGATNDRELQHALKMQIEAFKLKLADSI